MSPQPFILNLNNTPTQQLRQKLNHKSNITVKVLISKPFMQVFSFVSTFFTGAVAAATLGAQILYMGRMGQPLMAFPYEALL